MQHDSRRKSHFTWVGVGEKEPARTVTREEVVTQLTSKLHEVNSYEEVGHLVGRTGENIRTKVARNPAWRECVIGGRGKHRIPHAVAVEVIRSLMS